MFELDCLAQHAFDDERKYNPVVDACNGMTLQRHWRMTMAIY